MRIPFDKSRFLLLVVPLVSFTLYALTLPRTFVAVGDATEFAVAVLTNGIPHPSGYPLFVILGKLATLLPFGNKLLLINATSAVYGSLTVWLIALIVRRMTKNTAAGIFSGLVLAASFLFWKYSIVSEVFTLNTFLSLLLVYLALTISSNRGLYFFMLILGLSLSNHLTVIMVFPAVFYILWKRSKWQLSQLARALPFAVLGLIPYLYLLWAGKQYPLQNWENPDNISGVINIFFRRAYGTLNLAAVDLPVPDVGRQMADYFLLTVRQFTVIGLLMFILGLIYVWRYQRGKGMALLVTYLVTGIGFILMAGAPLGHLQLRTITERFLILPNLFYVIFMGFGMHLILHLIETYLADYFERLGLIFSLLVLCVPIYLGMTNFARADQRQNFFTQNLADDLLVSVPENSVLLVTGDAKFFSLIYAREVLGQRHDVALVSPALFSPERRDWYVPLLARHFPEIKLPNDLAYDDEGELLTAFIKENLPDRPVVCACGFLRERVNIAVPSKTVGLVEIYLPETPEGVTLEDVELENDELFTKLKNVNPRPDFPPDYIESDILREYAFPYVRLAHVYLQEELYEDAEKLYKKSLEIAPASYRLYRNLAEAYEKMKNRNEAVKALNTYITLNPYDKDIDEVKAKLESLRHL